MCPMEQVTWGDIFLRTKEILCTNIVHNTVFMFESMIYIYMIAQFNNSIYLTKRQGHTFKYNL